VDDAGAVDGRGRVDGRPPRLGRRRGTPRLFHIVHTAIIISFTLVESPRRRVNHVVNEFQRTGDSSGV
jgi:hypothetical protein